jgi:hypothetical protein
MKAVLSLALIATLLITPATAKDDGHQAERKQYIEKAISQGVFKKVVVPNDLPHVWVTPLFHSADFDIKQDLIGLVYYYYRLGDLPNLPLVVVKDSKTGKRIGKYTPAGLDMD